MAPKPIKVGILGLSHGWGVSAHLPYLQAHPEKFQVVAVCNSSVASSEKAIEKYELPKEAKGYGNPDDLAKDPDVELVVCAVRVDRHLPTITPSLKSQKAVFVEWPLGKNLQEAEDLTSLKNTHGVQFGFVDLQARKAPIVRKVKEIIAGGSIGKVLSSTWAGSATQGGNSTHENYEYLGRKEVGGNLVQIHFGHSVDYLQYVLGYGFSKPQSLLSNRRPLITLYSDDNKTVSKQHPKTAPDTIFFHGLISESNIPVSMTLRGGPPMKGTPGLEWRIYGEKGEIRLTASGPFLQIGYEDMKIEVSDEENGTVEEVGFADLEEFEELGMPGRNVGRVYEGIWDVMREGGEGAGREGLTTFEDAVERHRLLEEFWKQNEGYENSEVKA